MKSNDMLDSIPLVFHRGGRPKIQHLVPTNESGWAGARPPRAFACSIHNCGCRVLALFAKGHHQDDQDSDNPGYPPLETGLGLTVVAPASLYNAYLVSSVSLFSSACLRLETRKRARACFSQETRYTTGPAVDRGAGPVVCIECVDDGLTCVGLS